MNTMNIAFTKRFAADILEAEAQADKFVTKRTGADRQSDPVSLQAMHYNDVTKSISVFCSDGKTRECRVERLPGGVNAGRTLWKQLQVAGKSKAAVQFVSAGGFSPDRWFYSFL